MTTAVIPARYASTRFPGKMLAAETGKALICHVADHIAHCAAVDRVIVATDHEEIREVVAKAGHEVMMTRADHPNGSSRLAEVVQTLNLENELILNVQGDEPEVELDALQALVQRMQAASDILMGTLASPFAEGENPDNPNIVKVVLDQRGCALYFSRSRIPFCRDGKPAEGVAAPYLKHAGVYAYQGSFLLTYASFPVTPLEELEKLEQLRLLEHGYDIAVVQATLRSHGIDTPEQYAEFVARYRTSCSD